MSRCIGLGRIMLEVLSRIYRSDENYTASEVRLALTPVAANWTPSSVSIPTTFKR